MCGRLGKCRKELNQSQNKDFAKTKEKGCYIHYLSSILSTENTSTPVLDSSSDQVRSDEGDAGATHHRWEPWFFREISKERVKDVNELSYEMICFQMFHAGQLHSLQYDYFWDSPMAQCLVIHRLNSKPRNNFFKNRGGTKEMKISVRDATKPKIITSEHVEANWRLGPQCPKSDAQKSTLWGVES